MYPARRLSREGRRGGDRRPIGVRRQVRQMVEQGRRRTGQTGDLAGRWQVGNGTAHLGLHAVSNFGDGSPGRANLAGHLGEPIRSEQDHGHGRYDEKLCGIEIEHTFYSTHEHTLDEGCAEDPRSRRVLVIRLASSIRIH